MQIRHVNIDPVARLTLKELRNTTHDITDLVGVTPFIMRRRDTRHSNTNTKRSSPGYQYIPELYPGDAVQIVVQCAPSEAERTMPFSAYQAMQSSASLASRVLALAEAYKQASVRAMSSCQNKLACKNNAVN